MDKNATEVTIKWVPEDIKVLRPDFDDEQAALALQQLQKQLTDQSIQYGWTVLESNLHKPLWQRLIKKLQ